MVVRGVMEAHRGRVAISSWEIPGEFGVMAGESDVWGGDDIDDRV